MRLPILSVFVGGCFAGKCTDAEFKFWDKNAEFGDAILKCGAQGVSKTANCLADAYSGNITADCATCFGDVVRCGMEKCTDPCMMHGAHSDECYDCNENKKCNTEMRTCTGHPIGPPRPTRAIASAAVAAHASAAAVVAMLAAATHLIY